MTSHIVPTPQEADAPARTVVTYLPARQIAWGVTVVANLRWPHGGEERHHGAFVAVRDPQVSPAEAEAVASQLRSLGYFASPFPEGDGMIFAPPGDPKPCDIDVEAVAEDIRACSGWDVRIAPGETGR